MADRLPSSARTPYIRGPHPNAESTPLARNTSSRAGQSSRIETNREEQRRLQPSRIDEELTTERGDSQNTRLTQRRRIDSESYSSASEPTGSDIESSSPARKRDANRNVASKNAPPKNRHAAASIVQKNKRPVPANKRAYGNRNRVPPARSSTKPSHTNSKAGSSVVRRRRRPYARVLREIRRFRTMHGPEAYGLLIRRAPFARLVREVTNEVRDSHRLAQPIRWHVEALVALQEASEALIAHFFEDTNVLAAHARRITIMNRDAHTLMRLRQDR